MLPDKVSAFIGRQLWLTVRADGCHCVKVLVRLLAVTSSSSGMKRVRVQMEDGRLKNVDPFFLHLYNE